MKKLSYASLCHTSQLGLGHIRPRGPAGECVANIKGKKLDEIKFHISKINNHEIAWHCKTKG